MTRHPLPKLKLDENLDWSFTSVKSILVLPNRLEIKFEVPLLTFHPAFKEDLSKTNARQVVDATLTFTELSRVKTSNFELETDTGDSQTSKEQHFGEIWGVFYDGKTYVVEFLNGELHVDSAPPTLVISEPYL